MEPTTGEEFRYEKGKYRALKLHLLKKYGYCFWCKQPVKDYGDVTARRMSGLADPDDMATIDHLVSRFHRQKGEVVKKVLACYKCNTERSYEEHAKYNKAHQAKLSALQENKK